MKIKMIPETEAEKANMGEVEHTGVKEFFMFGSKNIDGEMIDFHDWKGSYKNLIGNTSYFTQVLISEMNAKSSVGPEISLKPIKKPMVKKSNPEDGKVDQIIDANDIKNEEIKPDPTPSDLINFPLITNDHKRKHTDTKNDCNISE